MRMIINILISVLTLVATPPPASIHSKEDLLAAKQELITAYENDDHDAFVEAFPSSFVDFARLFCYFPDIDYNLLYQNDYCEYFLFKGEEFDPRILDKLISISYGFIFGLGDASSDLTYSIRKLLSLYPKECATFFENKDDEEIVSFFRMTFQCYIPMEEKKFIMPILDNLSKYSNKLRPLMEEAYKLALVDSASLVVGYGDPYKIKWW